MNFAPARHSAAHLAQSFVLAWGICLQGCTPAQPWGAPGSGGATPPIQRIHAPQSGKPTLAPSIRQRDTRTLVLAAGAEPASIDPALCNDSVGAEVIGNLFAGLIELDAATLAPRPELAASWGVSDDGRTYTFLLRPNIAWSDGTPIVAQDFVDAWRRVLDPNTACRFANMLDVIDGAEAARTTGDAAKLAARAVDASTLQVRLRAPTPYFLQLLAYGLFKPVPTHVMARLQRAGKPADAWTRPQDIVSSGAYTLASWRFKRDYTLAKNPRYWDAAHVQIERAHVRLLENASTAVNLYRTGDIDWTGSAALPPSFVTALMGYADFYREPLLTTAFYWLNTTRPPLNDVRVRCALSLAIDRDALARYVMRGGQVPWANLVPQGMPGYPSPKTQGIDVPRAQRLLTEAGYPGGRGLPPLTLIYNTAEANRQVAEALQAMWQSQLGIEVGLQNEEWGVYLSHLAERDFAIARMGWTGDYPDAHSFLADVLGHDTGNNISGWSDPAFDELMRRAEECADGPARQRLMAQAETVAMAAMPLIPLYTAAQSGLAHPKLLGLTGSPQGLHPLKTMAWAP